MTAANLNQEFLDFINKATVLDLLKMKQETGAIPTVVTVNSNETLERVLDVMAQHKILALPVLENNVFIGFLDTMHIVSYTLLSWKYASWRLDKSAFLDKKFFQQTVAHIFNKTKHNEHRAAIVVSENATLKELLETLTNNVHGRVYRVAVGDATKLTAIITQRDCANFIYQHRNQLSKELLTNNISQLRLPHVPIMSYFDDEFVSSLELLSTHNVGGIAIVDDRHQITGSFSASDLRGLKPDHFEFFKGTTSQFLRNIKAYRAPITCNPLSTLEEVLDTMQKEKLHRIFVVDENSHLRGVITLSDLLLLFSFIAQYY